jgi:hypothetical protein
MRRVIIVITSVTFAIFGYLIYQYKVQENELTQLQEYQTVIQEKGVLIYKAAQDWTKPIFVDLTDFRLEDDYKIMADFSLNFIVQSAEARNSYIRELKAVKWDKFLDVKRLEKDKKQEYIETITMFEQVEMMMQLYQESIDLHDKEALDQVKHLKIKPRFRRYMADSFKDNIKQNNGQELLLLEKQNFTKAKVLFTILKNNKWESRNNMIMFHGEDAPVKEFNQLYKDMIELDKKIKQINIANQKAIEKQI